MLWFLKCPGARFLWLCGWTFPGTQRFNLDSALTRFLSLDTSPLENRGLAPMGTQCGGQRVCICPQGASGDHSSAWWGPSVRGSWGLLTGEVGAVIRWWPTRRPAPGRWHAGPVRPAPSVSGPWRAAARGAHRQPGAGTGCCGGCECVICEVTLAQCRDRKVSRWFDSERFNNPWSMFVFS